MTLVWLIVFAEPWRFLLLLAIPLLGVIYLSMQQNLAKRLLFLGEPRLMKRITPENSTLKQNLKFLFVSGAVICLIIDLAKPQLIYRTAITKPADIAIILDVSKSMMAKDIKPNRLEAAKTGIHSYLDEFEGSRLALIPFAGQCILEVPLTDDKKTFYSFLDQLNTHSIPVQGTNIAPALQLAIKSLPADAGRTRFILLFTDGENHEDGALVAVKEIENSGIHFLIFGIGNPEGAPIPDGNGKYKKDKAGNKIISRFRAAFLNSLAKQGGGMFFPLEMTDLHQPLNRMNKILRSLPKEYREEVQEWHFHLFLILALILLLIEFITFERKGAWFLEFRLIFMSFFRKRKIKRIPIILLLPASCAFLGLSILPNKGNAQAFFGKAREGNNFYSKGDYSDAEKAFRENIIPEKPQAQLLYNLGTALYSQNKYEQALKCFKAVLADSTALNFKSKASFNLGNTLFRQKKFEESIGAYQACLDLSPSDHNALYNLAYARYMLKKSQKKPPPPPPPIAQNALMNSSSQTASQKKEKKSPGAGLEKKKGDKVKTTKDLLKDW